jgi:dephospho-CoA kinase
MLLLGLTGSIGMGKSATAAMFAEAGVPVHDADACVHALYAGKAAPLIEATFPGTVENNVVDRERLGKAVLGDATALKRLETIVHPLVREAEQAFLQRARAANARIAVLDIPLLFEVGAEDRVDAIVVVSAPAEVQRARVLSRPGMSEEKFSALVAKQMPDAEKRRRAHFLVDTSRSLDSARAQVRGILRAASVMPGRRIM